MPDLHHYKGSFGGRVFPLWRDRAASEPNLPPKLLGFLERKYKTTVSAEDLMAYIAAVAAHPAYTARFQDDLAQPGLRIPLTANAQTFRKGRGAGPHQSSGCTPSASDAWTPRTAAPRSRRGWRRRTPRGCPPPERSRKGPTPCPTRSATMPSKKRLLVGDGYIDNVSPEVWSYEVSGKQVLPHWFSYRKRNREKPPMGDKRPPPTSAKFSPNRGPRSTPRSCSTSFTFSAGLLNWNDSQGELLVKICSGPTISLEELSASEALTVPAAWRKKLAAGSAASSAFFPRIKWNRRLSRTLSSLSIWQGLSRGDWRRLAPQPSVNAQDLAPN